MTFYEKIEVCEFYKNGTLKKKRLQQSLVDSVEGRKSPFNLTRQRQKLRRQQKYLNRKNLYPNKTKQKAFTCKKNTGMCELIVTFFVILNFRRIHTS